MLKIKIAEPTLEEVTHAIEQLEQIKEWLLLNEQVKERNK